MPTALHELATLWLYLTVAVGLFVVIALLHKDRPARTVRDLLWAWGGLSLLAWFPLGILALLYDGLGG